MEQKGVLFPPESAAEPAHRRKSAVQEEREFVGLFLYILKAPIVVHPDWADTFRDKWDPVLLNRLVHAPKLYPEGLCTEFEAMLYVSSASLAYPLNHAWTEIYVWLFHRWNPKAAEQANLGPSRDLDLQQQEDLGRLRRWIFQQQKRHLKAADRANPPEETPAAEEIAQPQLF